MDEMIFFNWFMILMIILAVIIFITLFKITAGYGQHVSKKWGRTINDRIGWVIMEAPTVILFLILYIIGKYQFNPVTLLFSTLFLMHYSYRTFVFPALMRGKRQMPLSIIAFGMMFNTANAYLQGRWINTLSGGYETSWFLTPVFNVGFIMFFMGFFTHMYSDHIIRILRKPGEIEFKIPQGGMFRLVSCPSYLGEILEWTGWAVMTFSFPGLVFVIWTIANLAPRARSNHKWYLETFPDYPKNRKALIPLLY